MKVLLALPVSPTDSVSLQFFKGFPASRTYGYHTRVERNPGEPWRLDHLDCVEDTFIFHKPGNPRPDNHPGISVDDETDLSSSTPCPYKRQVGDLQLVRRIKPQPPFRHIWCLAACDSGSVGFINLNGLVRPNPIACTDLAFCSLPIAIPAVPAPLQSLRTHSFFDCAPKGNKAP